MQTYKSRYIHKIATRSNNPGEDVTLADNDLDSTKTLAKALRKQGLLEKGQQIREWRIDPYIHNINRIVVFSRCSIWHSIILESKGNSDEKAV